LEGRFGKNILDENGNIDRKKLGNIIFKDGMMRKVINEIMHPMISEEMVKKINLFKDAGIEDIIIDAPIPVKHGFKDQAEAIITVMADEEIRSLRVMKRNNLDFSEVHNRLKSQDIFDYLTIANVILMNNEGMDELKSKVDELYGKLGEIV
jgi:dephospho-CoA kinase